MVHIYSPDRLIAVSHLLYGGALASYPSFARNLLPANASYATATDIPESDEQVGRSIP
jgi:hypothetical protein